MFHKNLGPLVSAEEMTRCIQCTRCVRFGQEIAGVMELGMIGRGEHAEIVSFVGKTVDSELSGNMIDICPVGALTSKPFRYAARTWELARRKSVSPHDSLGSNLIVQVKGDRVMRVLPLENEAVNECWISDKDRFSYEALDERGAADRADDQGGRRMEDRRLADGARVRRATACATSSRSTAARALGTLVSPHATLEEMALAARLARALGRDNIDFRLRQTRFPRRRPGRRHSVARDADRRPQRARPRARRRQLPAQGPSAGRAAAAPGGEEGRAGLAAAFGRRRFADPRRALVRRAAVACCRARSPRSSSPRRRAPASRCRRRSPASSPTAAAQAIAASLLSGERKAILLGNSAEQHPDASQLHALAQALAELTGATLGCLTEAANSVGGYVAGALPQSGGLERAGDARRPAQGLPRARAEPEFDCANPVAARAALEKADFVVVMSPFRHGTPYADVLLPIAPFTETAGTFVNCEGRVQTLQRRRASRSARRVPAWKVLRVLGIDARAARASISNRSTTCARRCCRGAGDVAAHARATARASRSRRPRRRGAGLERVADVPIYFADPLVRRAPSLQQTADARPPRARMHALTLSSSSASPTARRSRCGRAAARRC